jgi:hypothetical protein
VARAPAGLIMGRMQISQLTKEARHMRRIVTIAVVTCSLLVAIAGPVFAEPSSAAGREALARALGSAWLPLESGLVLSSTQGTPISAKYELEDGVLQLSVYTLKADTFSGDSFSEVIVDFSAGMIERTDVLVDGEDVSAAQSQKAALAGAKRSLGAVTADAVNANPGYRAVSAIPSLNGGHPVVEVILLRGTDWKVLSAPLD